MFLRFLPPRQPMHKRLILQGLGPGFPAERAVLLPRYCNTDAGRSTAPLTKHAFMEDHMNDLTHNATDVTPRRGFLARTAGVMALGFAGFASPLRAQTAASPSSGPSWPGALKGRYRQVVDAYEVNSGFPLAFVHTFLAPNDPSNTTGLLVLRHGAFPLALKDEMWKKYKIGEAFKIIDPETKAPAVKKSLLQTEVRRSAYRRHRAGPADRQGHRGRRLQRRADGAEQDALRQCRRDCGRCGEGMGRQRGPGRHNHPVGHMGREPRPGSRLQLLRRRLIGLARGPFRCVRFRSAAMTAPLRRGSHSPISNCL